MNPNDTPKEPTEQENTDVQNMENTTPNPEETGPVEMPTDSFGDGNNSTTEPASVPEFSPETKPETTVDLNDTPQPDVAGSADKPETLASNPFGAQDTPSDPTVPEAAVGTPTPIGGPAIQPPKKKSKKLLVIVASVLLVAGLATAGYLIFQSLQPAAAPASSETADATPEAEPVETSSDIQNEIDTIQEDIDAVTDEAFADEPIADDTLNAAE